MTSPIVRFAPSPTGLIHIGNARTALLNWLFAKTQGGRFILRFDDTDQERSRPEYAAAIEQDLRWLGVNPDLIERQSERFSFYNSAADRLRAMGRLYACYETPDELDRRRKRQLGRGLPPIYDRAALKLTAEEKTAFEAEGRRPHWRFLLDHTTVAWTDLVRGESKVDCGSLSDPVLVREDGTYLYTLPSVVDDIELGITHVIRGEDHVTNTAVQVQLFETLGASAPAFGHHNLLTTASGEGLSKRLGHLSLKSLREAGLEPQAVASLAVLVGSAEAVRAVPSLEQLGELVDLGHISRAPAKFDEAELEQLNARLLHERLFEAVRPQLDALGVACSEEFWLAVRSNLVRLKDILPLWKIVTGPISPVIDNAPLLDQARALLPPAPWDQSTWSQWTDSLKQQSGIKGKALFMPLRLALTGLDHGPELAALLPLIGEDKARARLSGQVA